MSGTGDERRYFIYIMASNPDWKDLAADWYAPEPTPEVIENWVARIAQEGATGR